MTFRNSYIVFALTLILNTSLGQSKDSIKLIIEIGSASFYPQLLDSVTFLNGDKKSTISFANVPTEKGTFAVSLSSGFYFIKLKAKGFKFRDSDCTAVCSKCDNNVHLACFEENGFAFSTVWMAPYYKKKINQDFKHSLSTKEIKNLQTVKDFKITFFVLRDKSLADITLESKNISKKNQTIIFKGLNNLKNWNLAIANGKDPVEGFVSIDFSRLMQE
jgi:hypothetical protein